MKEEEKLRGSEVKETAYMPPLAWLRALAEVEVREAKSKFTVLEQGVVRSATSTSCLRLFR